MPRAGELNWDNLFKGEVGEPEDSLSRPVEKDCHKGGDKITKEDLKKEADKIVAGFLRPGIAQATDEQLFGHLVVTEKQVTEAKDNWENIFNNFYKEANKDVDNIEHEWGNGKSFNSSLSKSEIEARNSFVDDNTDVDPI